MFAFLFSNNPTYQSRLLLTAIQDNLKKMFTSSTECDQKDASRGSEIENYTIKIQDGHQTLVTPFNELETHLSSYHFDLSYQRINNILREMHHTHPACTIIIERIRRLFKAMYPRTEEPNILTNLKPCHYTIDTSQHIIKQQRQLEITIQRGQQSVYTLTPTVTQNIDLNDGSYSYQFIECTNSPHPILLSMLKDPYALNDLHGFIDDPTRLNPQALEDLRLIKTVCQIKQDFNPYLSENAYKVENLLSAFFRDFNDRGQKSDCTAHLDAYSKLMALQHNMNPQDILELKKLTSNKQIFDALATHDTTPFISCRQCH